MKEGAASNPFFIEPMMALRAGNLPVGNWIYELKFDGYRALAFKDGKDVRLVSRNRTNFNKDYPQLVDSLRLLTANKVTVDGEITALDENGNLHSNFSNRTEPVSKSRWSITLSICSS